MAVKKIKMCYLLNGLLCLVASTYFSVPSYAQTNAQVSPDVMLSAEDFLFGSQNEEIDSVSEPIVENMSDPDELKENVSLSKTLPAALKGGESSEIPTVNEKIDDVVTDANQEMEENTEFVDNDLKQSSFLDRHKLKSNGSNENSSEQFLMPSNDNKMITYVEIEYESVIISLERKIMILEKEKEALRKRLKEYEGNSISDLILRENPSEMIR